MKIAIDISQIVYEGSGVSRYLNFLIKGLLQYDQKNKYTFFFSSLRKKIDKSLEKKIKEKNQLKKFPFPPTILDFLWNRLHVFPIENLIGNNDIFFSSDWTEPPTKSFKITTIHDLVYLKFPQTMTEKIINVQKRRLKWVKKESNLIIADSKTTKKDIINLLKIPSKKIEVVYPAVEVNVNPKSIVNRTLKKLNFNRPFILTVGKLEPRKNIKKLINAFLKAKLKNIDLVIVGQKGWGELYSDYFKYTLPNIKFLGFIPDIDLYSLYQSALFFIYPSLYEGFGYPVVEAMKLDCPVATSNTSSLEEIGKNSALLFNPEKETEITKAIINLYQNPRLRERLIIAGRKKRNIFSLKKFSYQLINIFEKFNENP